MINELGFLTTNTTRKIDKHSSASRLKLKPVDFMTVEELQSLPSGSVMIFDVECYRNFFYVAFKSLVNNKYVAFEKSPEFELHIDGLLWVMWNFTVVGFNSKNYDVPIIELASKGVTCSELKDATDFIIVGNNRPFNFERQYGIKINNYNHIDIMEVAPLQASLKCYGGRLHCDTMQDLPFEPDHILTADDAKIIRPYCCNDLDNTQILFESLAKQLDLRVNMSKEYGIDLRSKSDAQIAEAVINNELQKVLGFYPKRPKIDSNTVLKYNVPDFIAFRNKDLRFVLQTIKDSLFYLDGSGSPIMPPELAKLTVMLGSTVYNLGMGGLHSQEKTIAHKSDESTLIADNDVASYYPRVILNQGLFPPHLGEAFLTVYDSIVRRRLDAKAKGMKTIADTLKIVINGSFGKFGSKWSSLYAPQLMLQVTLTGQLALLMLIEMLTEEGINVVSGNTDGIVSKYDKSRHEQVRSIIETWEKWTGFETEETRYKALYSRDVNNYIAVKEDDTAKTKGTYAKSGLSKNPEHYICTKAVLDYLIKGTPVEKTVTDCKDISNFVIVRNVKGGGEKDGLYLGKVVRWYYAKGEAGFISYVGSGNKVAKSDGAQPLMDLPETMPTNIDYAKYIKIATDMLKDCGAISEPKTALLFDF